MQEAADQWRVSPRLKDALIADLFMESPDAGTDDLLVHPPQDKREMTTHLARQLGMSMALDPDGLHDTLLFLLIQLEVSLREWPPQADGGACQKMVFETIKNLTSVEVYATVMAGPAKWQQATIADCRVKNLHKHLAKLLQKSLAAEVKGMLDRWVKWDVRRLRDRRDELAKATTATNASPPSTPNVGARMTRRDPKDRMTKLYQPPGHT